MLFFLFVYHWNWIFDIAYYKLTSNELLTNYKKMYEILKNNVIIKIGIQF